MSLFFSDNLIPDDYIWFILMKIMIDGRESISFEKIDEVSAGYFKF